MLLGAAIGVAVVLPLMGGGWLLLLDWTSGPRLDFPREAYGLDGGLLYGDFALLQWLVSGLVGPRLTQIVLVVVIFPVAAWSMGRLVGGPLQRRVPAALLYCVNPFVFERLAAGQVALLAGYAVLPLIAAAFLRLSRGGWRAGWRAGVVLAVGIAFIIHTVWLAAVLFIAAVPPTRGRLRGTVIALSALALTTAVLTAHLWLPQIDSFLPIRSDPRELAAFRTSGDDRVGLLVNVIGLYGFWRTDTAALPKEVAPGWLPVLAALLVLVVLGVVTGLRSEGRQRQLTVTMLVAGVAGVVLALGDQGPLAFAYREVFEASSLASTMREPQKFLALTALAYSVAIGLATERLCSHGPLRHGLRRAVPMVLALGAVLLYTPTLGYGLGGHARPSEFPEGWRIAEQRMGTGQGAVLVLPWHRFVAFPFTHGVVVRNPAPHYFSREVIVGDNVEVRGIRTLSRRERSAYLKDLFASGATRSDFGARVSPLGVEYVLLAKTADWESYQWLRFQADLELVYDDDDVALYRNSSAASHPSTRQVERISPTRYAVSVEAAARVSLPEPYDPAWRLDGERPQPTDFGTVGFDAPAGRSTAQVRRPTVAVGWTVTAVGIVVSLVLMRLRRVNGAHPRGGTNTA